MFVVADVVVAAGEVVDVAAHAEDVVAAAVVENEGAAKKMIDDGKYVAAEGVVAQIVIQTITQPKGQMAINFVEKSYAAAVVAAAVVDFVH